ncbi:hypothetical protein KQI84_08545 [bacterium]|nr:hypothetical protein [bacterium]
MVASALLRRGAAALAMIVLAVSVAQAGRWVLVDFGTSDGTSTTPYGDWNQILRHSTNVEYVDPDGNPAHQGITEIESLAEGDPSFAGIQGTTPISFARGNAIICTFYNRDVNESYFHARLSLTDADSPDPSDTTNAWYTMTGDIGYGLEAGQTAEFVYYISDATMGNHLLAPPSVGDAVRVNINKRYPNPAIVLTRIEFTDEADLTAPSAPGSLTAQLQAATAGTSLNHVRLEWSASTDPAPNATGVNRYLIYRDGALFDNVAPDMVEYYGTDNLHYVDHQVAPGSTHSYSVTALDAAPYGMYPSEEQPTRRHGNESDFATTVTIGVPAWSGAALIDPYSQLQYLGAIRLPVDLEPWMDYVSDGLAFCPTGNPDYDSGTEWPGSLYVLTRLCERVCEISIPQAVDSANIDDAPRATTLQAPVDIWPHVYDGQYYPQGGGWATGGITYHPGGNGVGPHLFYGITDGYGSPQDQPHHGAFDLDLTTANGPWFLGEAPPNHVPPALTSMILFPAPQSWADATVGGRSLICGNAYQSGLGVPSHGPSLFATAPWESGALPAQNETCSAIELLRYSSGATPEHRVENWSMGEDGQGGAWLEIGGSSAVVMSTIRCVGDHWYGYADGTFQSDDDIPEPMFGGRGNGASDWKMSLLFYNPADLETVAAGTMESWEPQPYAVFDLDQFSRKPGGTELSGAITYDATNQRIYLIEFNGDPGYEWGYDMLHAFALQPGAAIPEFEAGWMLR